MSRKHKVVKVLDLLKVDWEKIGLMYRHTDSQKSLQIISSIAYPAFDLCLNWLTG